MNGILAMLLGSAVTIGLLFLGIITGIVGTFITSFLMTFFIISVLDAINPE